MVEDDMKRATDQPGKRADRQAGEREPDETGAVFVFVPLRRRALFIASSIFEHD
jgi:hypothetical protein